MASELSRKYISDYKQFSLLNVMKNEQTFKNIVPAYVCSYLCFIQVG
jgi:hypothetical protein